MYRYVAALLGVAACATNAQAQRPSSPESGPILTLSDALHLADQASPEIEAAEAGTRAASAARQIASLRPNPSINADIENVGGSAVYDAIEAPKQTVSVGLPVELGGKRSARIAVADAQSERTRIDLQAAEQDLHLAVTQAYIDAEAADRRVDGAREQATIAADALHAAQIRVQAGRASPLEAQRAEVLRINADAAVDRAMRLAALAKANLARRIGRPVTDPLDGAWFNRIGGYGPPNGPANSSNLALARANADARVAAAQVRLARSQRVPDVTVSAGLRRLPVNNDVAAVFGISVPLPLFNNGSAAVAQASAEQDKADALKRAALLDHDQAINQAEADLANAAASARTASGPSLAAAQEAARIARIGYREGKFGQLDLLEAERTLSETRAAAIDALAAYHVAQAQLDRLTATTSKD